MLKVGLTGNIAAGKSVVSGVWRELGAPVIDADELARRAVEPGTEALQAITTRWGDRVLGDDGRLDRSALREIVFRDADERARLEQIVHPAVRRLRADALARLEESGERIVVADIPLLYEVGMERDFDVVVVVHASARTRLRRLIEDRGLDPAGARRMVDSQMPSERKRERADVVIDNEGTVEELERRAREVWEGLVARAGGIA
jgi:dephospho-CoA kinase